MSDTWPGKPGRKVGFMVPSPFERSFFRKSYLAATARLLFVHGPNCYARAELNIPPDSDHPFVAAPNLFVHVPASP